MTLDERLFQYHIYIQRKYTLNLYKFSDMIFLFDKLARKVKKIYFKSNITKIRLYNRIMNMLIHSYYTNVEDKIHMVSNRVIIIHRNIK